MATLTVSAAARLCGVDRRTLQRAIHAGRLALDAQHGLSREALIAAGYLDPTPQQTPHETPQVEPQRLPQDTSQGMPQELEQATTLLELLAQLTTAITALHAEVRELRDELHQLPQRRRRPRAALPHLTPQDTPQGMPQRLPQDVPQDTPPGMPHPSPQILGTYDPHAAAARIHTLRRQGLSFVQIAAQLDVEGVPTRYGLPWQYSSVRHLFHTYSEA
jgi:hypothetical protein